MVDGDTIAGGPLFTYVFNSLYLIVGLFESLASFRLSRIYIYFGPLAVKF